MNIVGNAKYANMLFKFFEYLQKETKSSLTMGIGFSVVKSADIERNLHFDIKMSDYEFEKKELDEYFEKTPEKSISSFIFNFNFNNYCILNKRVIQKFNEINKIKTIIFDSSTFKFLINIKFVGMLFYFALETDGEIYIESNTPTNVGVIVDKLHELYNNIKLDEGGFKYPSVLTITNHLLSCVPTEKLEDVNKHIYDKEQIYNHNLEYLRKWFYGSKVELIEDEHYPISNPKYPIKKYYKITKVLSHHEILDKINIDVSEYNKGLGLKSCCIVKLETFQ